MLQPLFALLLFAALAQMPQVPQAPAAAGPPSPEQVRQELLAIVNDERAAAGVSPLHLRAPLNQVAQQNAEEARDNQAALYDEKAIPRIQGRLRKALAQRERDRDRCRADG